MRRLNSSILFILAFSLLLRADACTEQKDVDLVFGSDFVASLQSSDGFTEAHDEDQVSVAADEDLLEAIDELDFDGEITAIQINGARFEIVSNQGHDARRTGQVFVSINNAPEFKLMDWNSPNNQPGTKGFASANALEPGTPGIRFKTAGLLSVNAALQTFLDGYNAGNPPALTFDFRASWTSTPAPTAQDPDDFQWEAALLFQLEQTAQLDVPSF